MKSNVKKLMFLITVLSLAACEDSGPSATSSGGSLPSDFGEISYFEREQKANAQAILDDAALKFDPCKDEYDVIDTRTVSFNGHTFTTDTDILGTESLKDCHQRILRSGMVIELEPDTPLPEWDEFTFISIASSGALIVKSVGRSGGQGQLQNFMSETTTRGEMMLHLEKYPIEDGGGHKTHDLYSSRLDASDIYKYSSSMMLAYSDRFSGDYSLNFYNSVAGEIDAALSTFEATGETIPDYDLMRLEITSLRMLDFSSTDPDHVMQNGSVGFAFFDRKLTASEQRLLGCYGLYLTTIFDDTTLWDNHSGVVCGY